jgi:putative ABC transport system permease protein
MPFEVAWRALNYQKGRTALAVGGIFVAILLIFVELGFFIAVPRGGMLLYDHLRFDLLLCSKQYIFMAQSWQFPRARLAAAANVPGVTQATPIYFADAKWQDPSGGLRIDISVIGFDPRSGAFAAVPGIERRIAVLQRPDTVLVDSSTRSIFGPLRTGRPVDLNGHRIVIDGRYRLGAGFLGLGVALADQANFFRIFPDRSPNQVNLGLITLKPGAGRDQVARALRALLPSDVQVLTRSELAAREIAYWTTKTGTGVIFGSGLVVAFVVGVMILYQTLATQIARQLPQFAMLKAIGCASRSLDGIVLVEAMMVVLAAFAPALAAALGIYSVIRDETLLPVTLNLAELAAVFALALVMSGLSALLSLARLRRADPAEIF